MDSHLFARIVPLAVGSAVSPAILVVALEILATGGDRRRRLIAIYFAGIALIPTILVVLGIFAESILFRHYPDENVAIDGIDITLGVLLLATGLWILVARNKPKSDKPLLTCRSAFGLGLVQMGTNFSTLIMTFAGIREIVHARPTVGVSLLANLLLVAGAAAPVWIPMLADYLAPAGLHQALVPLNRFATRYGRYVGALVSGLTGLYLLLRGINLTL